MISRFITLEVIVVALFFTTFKISGIHSVSSQPHADLYV